MKSDNKLQMNGKAAIEERLAQEQTVSDILRDLRVEDIKDEQEKAEAQLEIQKQAALKELRENKATKEQLAEAELLYENQLSQMRQEFADAEAQKRKEREEAELQEYKDKQARLKEILDIAYFESIENEFQRAQEELAFEEQKAMEELALLGATEEQKQRIRDQYQKKREKLAKEEADYNVALKKAEKDNELQLAVGAFGAIASLVGEQTAVGKAAAIAATTIQTYQAAQAAYASQLIPGDPTSPVRATIAAGIAVASGIANVQQILSTPTPSAGGGGGGAGGGVPSRPTVPTFNPEAALDATAAGQEGAATVTASQQGTQAPIRAYVVATEVTSEQEANKKIEDLAKL